MTTTSRKSQIEAALLVGLDLLELGRAYFSRVDVSTHELVTECSVAADGDRLDDLPVGRRYPLRGTIIGRAIARNDVVAILDFDAHCRAQGVRNYAHGGSYIAVPIIIDGSPYGAIGFLGRETRIEPFTAGKYRIREDYGPVDRFLGAAFVAERAARRAGLLRRLDRFARIAFCCTIVSYKRSSPRSDAASASPSCSSTSTDSKK